MGFDLNSDYLIDFVISLTNNKFTTRNKSFFTDSYSITKAQQSRGINEFNFASLLR